MRRTSSDVIVAGAGPVGLLTALALARRGVSVTVIDRAEGPGTRNYAAGLHPASLQILNDLGLQKTVSSAMTTVNRLKFHAPDNEDRSVDLTRLPGDGHVGVLAQSQLERILVDALQKAGVQLLWNHRLAGFTQNSDNVAAEIQRIEESITGYAVAHFDWSVAEEFSLRARFLIGADGHLSFVRRRLHIDLQRVGKRDHFAVYEFESPDRTGSDIEVDLAHGAPSALWPMPDKTWRFSFQVPEKASMWESRDKDHLLVQIGPAAYPLLDRELLDELVRDRAPWWNGEIGRIRWRVAVAFEKRLAESYGRDRVWLVGDAAHTTGPLGMQSMNVGLREAVALAKALEEALRDGSAKHASLTAYGSRFTDEWKQLLGLQDPPTAQDETPRWVRHHEKQILELLPASGDSLAHLCSQLKLKLPKTR